MTEKPLRPEEQWVQSILARELGVSVEQNDDGSQPAMHDLTVLFPDRRRGAVEVTAAVDSESTEFWNILTGKGRWIFEGIEGGWAVYVDPSPRAKALYEKLPGLLRSLEEVGVREYRGSQGGAPDGHELAP